MLSETLRDDFPILHSVPGFAAFLSPAGKIFSIEDGDKTSFFSTEAVRQAKRQAYQSVLHAVRVRVTGSDGNPRQSNISHPLGGINE